MILCRRFLAFSMLVLLSKTTVQQMFRGLTSKHEFNELQGRNNFYSLHSKVKLSYQQEFRQKTVPSSEQPTQRSSNEDSKRIDFKTVNSKTREKTSRLQSGKLSTQDVCCDKNPILQRNGDSLFKDSKDVSYKTQKRNSFTEKEMRIKQEKKSSHQSAKESRREKRAVFIPDTRRLVNTTTMSQRFPFSATVKISTGCSGSLISTRHILTAAHCIHNGSTFIYTTRKLRVGFLKRNGKYRWYRVNTYYIPQEWSASHGAQNDYAVVKLRKPTSRKYFQVRISNTKLLPIHFASFPGDKRTNTMWYSSCKAKVHGGAILSRCDAARGSSGAGLYTNNNHGERVIIGILSGAVTERFKNGKKLHFNVGFRVTQKSGRRICRWAGWPIGCLF